MNPATGNTENIVPNGNIPAPDGISPTHAAAKYVSPHIGNISSKGAIDLISRSTSAKSMDHQRKEHIAYEYLCHLEEAKNWMEACIEEDLPSASEIDEALRTGVILCKLGHWCAPEALPLKKIYDLDGSKFAAKGLHFKHTDNFNFWLRALKKVGLPEIFYPETTDLYDKKNMPRVIYCIHALSLFLHKLGKAPEIQNLVGTVEFTEEEISAMQVELDKYGINMPSFGKIGGILANEMSVDQAAIHAAVLAINNALDGDDAKDIMSKLQNPCAVLENIIEGNEDRYVTRLKNTKEAKCESNKGTKAAPETDAYDFMLTQTEIQTCITEVNAEVEKEIADAKLKEALVGINNASDGGKLSELLRALQNEDAKLHEVNPQNVRWYSEVLNKTRRQNLELGEECDLTLDEIQDIIIVANEIAEHTRLVEAAIVELNGTLRNGEDTVPDQLLEVLQNENLSLRAVSPDNIEYYCRGLKERLQKKREESGNPHAMLTEDEIQDEVHECNRRASLDYKIKLALDSLNSAIQEDGPDSLMAAITGEYAGIDGVESSVGGVRYHKQLQQARAEKGEPLTREEIVENIKKVNEEVRLERLLTEGVTSINNLVGAGDHTPSQLLETLQNEYVGLQRVEPANAVYYGTLLKKKQTSTSRLSKEDIQTVIDTANDQTVESIELAKAISSINTSLEGNNPSATLASLKHSKVNLRSITDDCAEEYLKKLTEAKAEKMANGGVAGWAEHRSKEGYTYYYDDIAESHSWAKPEDYTATSATLSREEVQAIVTKVTADYDRWALLQSNEPIIITLQSLWRGLQVRRAFNERLAYLRGHESQAVVLQAHWKGHVQRKAYKERMEYLRLNVAVIIRIQSWVKMYRARKAYRARLDFFKANIAAIIRIQTFWRAKKTKKEYKQLGTNIDLETY